TFAGSASNVSVVGDTTGTPSVTLSYTVPTGGGGSGGGTGGSAPPSNQFQLSPAIVGRSGTINLPLNAPGPGTVIGVAKTSVPVNARVLVRASKKRRRARTIT